VGQFYTHCNQKAWGKALLIIKWIDLVFPLADTAVRKCIIWESCKAHIAKNVQECCQSSNIELIGIPGSLTPFLQAGEIRIF
jgi:hypothetical protein